MKHFEIVRADDCIWLTDTRGEKPIQIHLVPSQAKEVGEALIEISTKEKGSQSC